MLPMSTSSPASTPTRDSRIRKLQGQPRKLVRNSSLFGSIKNFVAAPFSRLFTGSSEEFDDEKDLSGKRRRYQNGIQNNNEAYEDGPAPAKRLRVGSPSLSPPPPASRSAYLDPPSSAFKRATSTSIYNPPSRATSITIPSTTISDSNARSTISPLRRQLSSGMSIDPHPTSATNPRPISRDVSMAAIPHVASGQQDAALQRPERLPSRDRSMPPLSSRPSFIMRNSMTPQPHPQRDVSEPPPMTSLSSYPVFVRGPSQAKETQPKTTTTLGSLVDSKRNATSSRQRQSALFGRVGQSDPQSTLAEKVLHELDYYKTPLVPTRLRKAPRNAHTPSDITDMFSRKHSIVLMGDDDHSSRLGKRSRKERRGKTKEDNESKPYAGITGLKKRLARHKEEAKDTSDDAEGNKGDASPAQPEGSRATEPVAEAIPAPAPPPPGTDWFSLASTSAVSSSSPQASSLRVGRASRTHLSRPSRPNKPKFSAAFDDDEEISETSKKEMEELEEAAKKIPVFSISDGFTFAKEDKPVQQDSSVGKEPPISSLPFSLFHPQASVSSPGTKEPASSPQTIATPSTTTLDRPRSDVGSVPIPSQPTPVVTTESPSGSTTENKVPNFFASSKMLSVQTPSAPTFVINNDKKQASSTDSSSTGSSSAPFSFGAPSSSGLITASIPVKENVGMAWQGADDKLSSTSPFGTPSTFSFSSQGDGTLMPPIEVSKKESSSTASQSTEPPAFSFTRSDDTPKPTSTPSFSFGVPQSDTSSNPASAPAFGNDKSLFGGNTDTGATDIGIGSSGSPFSPTPESATKATPPTSLFGGSSEKSLSEAPKQASSSTFLFGQPQKSEVPTGSTLFGSSVAKKPSSGFTFEQPNTVSTSSSVTTSAFSFGDRGSTSAPTNTKALFATDGSTNDGTKPFSFGNTSGDTSAPSTESTGASKPFPFGSGSTSTNSFGESKSTGFGFGSRPVTPPNQDNEIKMDESPTRDMQFNAKPVEPRPTLGNFSFNSTPSFGVGQSSTAASSPFAFGSASTTSSSFGGLKADEKPESKGFGFGQTHTMNNSSPFSFGSKPTENDPPRPSTTGSFSFGSSSASTPTPSFSFGNSNTSTLNTTSFGQLSGSAPSSPSTFGPPPSISFGGGTSGNPFTFGSQPASPATPSSTLPPASGFGSTGGFGAQPSPSSNLFTIGSAPTSTGTVPQGRQIKRLPKRGGKR